MDDHQTRCRSVGEHRVDVVEREHHDRGLRFIVDVARVRALLGRGMIREAVEHCEGPLLPRSEAPGIVRERDELDAWVLQVVMSADDREALWAWVECRSGRDDLPGWNLLLTQLDFRDPRRALAAARVRSLRAALATA